MKFTAAAVQMVATDDKAANCAEAARWVRGAAEQGARGVTLRTFADVPWNAPFYARLGFTPVPEPLPAFLQLLRDREIRMGIDQGGRRVAMGRQVP